MNKKINKKFKPYDGDSQSIFFSNQGFFSSFQKLAVETSILPSANCASQHSLVY